PWSPPRAVYVRQRAYVVYLQWYAGRATQLAFPRHEPLNHLGPPGERLVPCRLILEVHHPHSFWNPLGREASERRDQGRLVGSFVDALERLAAKDPHPVPAVDLRHPAPQLARKCLGQGRLQYPPDV